MKSIYCFSVPYLSFAGPVKYSVFKRLRVYPNRNIPEIYFVVKHPSYIIGFL